MKIIDLLNKIANGEEVPKKIKCGEYYFDFRNGRYYNSEYSSEHIEEVLGSYFRLDGMLNDTVEILEEEKKIPEKLFHCCMGTDNEEIKFLIQNINDLSDKYNQLIDYLKSKGE